MKTYRAIKTFKSRCKVGPFVVHEGSLFMVKKIADLPHDEGRHPDYDSNLFTEEDKWANTDEWKNSYEEVMIISLPKEAE